MKSENYFEIRERSPFTIATNNMKYLGVILTKQVKDLFDKNFKSLKKETEEDIRKGIPHAHGILHPVPYATFEKNEHDRK
ncbi:hypothetical protein STEG23_007724 [Scotinomys teguina]